MDLSRRSGRSRFVLVLLVLASLTVLTLDYRDAGPVRAIRDGAATVLEPVRGAADAVADPFRNGWNGLTGYDDLKERNEELQRRIDELEGDAIRGEAAREEVEELRSALEIDFVAELPTVTAEVISGPNTSFESSVRINKGSGDGLDVGMPVVTNAGMVGRISRVTGGRAALELISEPSFRFGVRLVEVGEVGIAHGTGRGRDLRVDAGILAETEVSRGDAVITSGYDASAFPPRIPVGTVEDVSSTEDGTEQSLAIDPVANLSGLSYVTVLACTGDDCA